MRNLILFGTILFTMLTSMYIGVSRLHAAQSAANAQRPPADADAPAIATETPPAEQPRETPPAPASARSSVNVPHIGSIQVLNGCNIEGAAKRVADFLRAKNFDVKDIGNASSWNHQFTMVISRTANMSLAHELEKHLKTGKVALMRNNEQLYDVTVIVGPDFEDRIK